MRDLRISVTTLEQFRLYLKDTFVTEESLLASIRGEFKPTRPMLLGTAFHAILETPNECRRGDGTYTAEGIVFPADVVEPCLEVFDRSGVFEVKLPKVYHVDGREMTVVAKADQLVGRESVENKTKWSAFYIDNYMDSYQWRFYLDIFEASRVKYNVFCISENAGGFRLNSIEQFSMYPYPALQRDCYNLLRHFVEFVDAKQLGSYLQPRAA